jgi:hypothetical protein
MFLNIVTPCSRPQNLHLISNSINIPRDCYRWIVVFDGNEPPTKNLIPDNCEIYCFQDKDSAYGHYQRNYALELIKDGYVYFNDDDTILHRNLWDNIRMLENDFITFNQLHQNGMPRLTSPIIEVGQVDSHTFIFKRELSGDLKFLNAYVADGIFATELSKRAKNPIHLVKFLSVYNSLR